MGFWGQGGIAWELGWEFAWGFDRQILDNVKHFKVGEMKFVKDMIPMEGVLFL